MSYVFRGTVESVANSQGWYNALMISKSESARRQNFRFVAGIKS